MGTPLEPSTTPASAVSATGPGEGLRRGRPGYDRESLLNVCVDVFNVHGYDATSMGMLAQQLGISKSAIYHHVSSKEEILEQALSRALDALETVVDTAAEDASAPAVERLERSVRGTLHVLVEQMPSVTLLLRLRGNSEVEKRALERRREITRHVGGLIEQAQAEGGVRSDISPRNMARLMLGMINSIVDWYRPDGNRPVEDMVDAVTGLVFRGLRT